VAAGCVGRRGAVEVVDGSCIVEGGVSERVIDVGWASWCDVLLLPVWMEGCGYSEWSF
jgi:hypothetical protein